MFVRAQQLTTSGRFLSSALHRRLRDCIQLGCCLSRSIRAALRPRPRGCRKLFLLRTTMSPRQKDRPKIEGRPVWAEVSASALTHNLRAIRDFVNPADEKRKTPRMVLSIVKGNGYGHGGPQVARILEKAGSVGFGG